MPSKQTKLQRRHFLLIPTQGWHQWAESVAKTHFPTECDFYGWQRLETHCKHSNFHLFNKSSPPKQTTYASERYHYKVQRCGQWKEFHFYATNTDVIRRAVNTDGTIINEETWRTVQKSSRVSLALWCESHRRLEGTNARGGRGLGPG